MQHNAITQSRILALLNFSQGLPDDRTRSMLSEASRIANTTGGSWIAATFDQPSQEAIDCCASFGLATLIILEQPTENASNQPDTQAHIFAGAGLASEADIFLLAHDDMGGNLAPMVAAITGAALFPRAIALTNNQHQGLAMTHRILGHQVARTRYWKRECPLVLSIDTSIMSAVRLPSTRPCTTRTEHFALKADPPASRCRVTEHIPPDPQTVDVAEAEVMISTGLGCGENDLEIVREIASAMGASLGVTRPAYDLGHAGFERMVGQTGKTVAPRFYLALGISGSMHHIGGINDSGRIVSVNIDSRAPVFANSDEGFVADLREILPILRDRIRKSTGGAA